MSPYTLLAIDLGTSAIKLMTVDRTMEVLAVERIPIAGLDPQAWAEAIRTRTRAAPDPGTIAAIAITGQMHGLVPLLDDGFGPGIPWTDQRGRAVLPDLLDALGAGLPERLGGDLATGFQAVSLLWLRQHEPETWRRIHRVMLPKDALVFQITGRHVTDPSDAAGTGMYEPRTGTWASDVLEAIGIPRSWLPEVVPSGTIVGRVTDEAAHRFGLHPGVPVVIAGGDAAAGALGGRARRPDDVLVLLSTGAQIIQPAAVWAPDPTGRWYTWPATVPYGSSLPPYLRVGTLLNAGNVTAWVRETLREPNGIASEPTGLLVLPHLLGERTPLRDPLARGVILGIRPETTPAAIARAALEGVAFALRHALETMTSDVPPTTVRAGGGGAHDAAWLRIITDVLGMPVRREETRELSTFGAALLGGHALGWIDLDEWFAASGGSAAIRPDPDRHRRYDALYRIYREAVNAVAPISHRLAGWDSCRP